MDFIKPLREALRDAEEFHSEIMNLAAELGCDTGPSTSLYAAWQKIRSACRRLSKADAKARELGYGSLEQLLKGASLRKSMPLPEGYQTPPAHWLQEKGLVRVRFGLHEAHRTVAEVTPRRATEMLQSLAPQLNMIVAHYHDDEEFLSNLEEAFHSMSFHDFSSDLYAEVASLRGHGPD